MAADPALDARLDALEMRVAHQEATLEDLNAALTAQWTGIDYLQRQVSVLRERLREAEARAAPFAGAEPPPPHY